jgi:glutathione S-transferase
MSLMVVLALNPFGQVPVLLDEAVVLRDSQAILLYLALKHPAAGFYPTTVAAQCAVQSWLSIASSEVSRGPGLLRLHHRFGKVIDVASAQQTTRQLLQVLNAALATQSWLVGSSVTIADVAMYPYLALAHEGQVNLVDYPAINQWLAAVETLPGFVTMTGIQLQQNKVNQ